MTIRPLLRSAVSTWILACALTTTRADASCAMPKPQVRTLTLVSVQVDGQPLADTAKWQFWQAFAQRRLDALQLNFRSTACLNLPATCTPTTEDFHAP